MLVVSQAIQNALNADVLQINALVEFVVGANTWRLANANNDITISIGGVNKTFSPAGSTIESVALPDESDELGRDLHELTILDDDANTWHKRFLEYPKLTVSLWVVFGAAGGGYTDALDIYKGTCVGMSYEQSKSESRRLVLVFSGQIMQLDAEHEAVTTDANQRTRDPTDTAFARAQVVRTFTWGKR